MFALFLRIKVQGEFRKWQYAGIETSTAKIDKFITDCQEENGPDSVRVFDMNRIEDEQWPGLTVAHRR